MTEVAALDRDAAKRQPENVFDSPLDIVNEVMLTKGEKLGTLERWRSSILGGIAASNEGMAPHGYTDEGLIVLAAIAEAKARVKEGVKPQTPN